MLSASGKAMLRWYVVGRAGWGLRLEGKGKHARDGDRCAEQWNRVLAIDRSSSLISFTNARALVMERCVTGR